MASSSRRPKRSASAARNTIRDSRSWPSSICLEHRRHRRPRPRLRRLLREAVREVRAHSDHGAAGRAEVVEGLRRCHDHLAARQAVGEESDSPGARDLRPIAFCSASIICRMPPARSCAPRSKKRPSSRSTVSANGRRRPWVAAKAPTSSCCARCASRIRSACSTAPSPPSSASK